MDYSEQTNFVESNAFLAVVGEDNNAALEILEELTPAQLRTVHDACYELGALCKQVKREREETARSKMTVDERINKLLGA